MIRLFLLLLIKIYQFFLSPFLSKNCIFIPTCSEYAVDLLKSKKYNIYICVYKIVKRVMSCQNIGKNKEISVKDE